MNMDIDHHDSKCSISVTERALFVPRVLVTGGAKRRVISSGEYLDCDDFERGDLLLMQDRRGAYWWAFFENLFRKDSKMHLHPCTLSHQQAESIIRKRVLFIADRDTRLSEFGNLSQWGATPTVDETLERLDLATRHLATSREVHIFAVDPDGTRFCDEVKTADYRRAKADIRRDAANTRNMRRFCNRQWNGEGPSKLDSRICHGKIPKRTTWLPSSPFKPSRRPSTSNSSSSSSYSSAPLNVYFWEPPAPEPPKPCCTTYYMMRLALAAPAKLEAHRYEHALKRARRGKRPEGYKPAPPPAPQSPSPPQLRRPSRWTAVAKQVRGFCRDVHRPRPPCVITGSSRWPIESDDGDGWDAEAQDETRKQSRRDRWGGWFSQRSSSVTLVDGGDGEEEEEEEEEDVKGKGREEDGDEDEDEEDDDMSLLTLPAPALEGITAAQWIETRRTFSAVAHVRNSTITTTTITATNTTTTAAAGRIGRGTFKTARHMKRSRPFSFFSSSSSSKMEILNGVPAEERAPLLRTTQDIRGEGIITTTSSAACASRAAFADPGLSTGAGVGRVQRNWAGNVGWEWMFSEGLG